MLATDAASSIGGRLEDSSEIGIIQGAGRRSGSALRFQLLDSTVTMRPGQRIVSFGSQGNTPYVPGVPIGAVAKIERTPGALSRTAIVRPFAHFTGLDVVGVVVGAPKRNPRDAVLPPTPTPSPTPPPPKPKPPAHPRSTPASPKSAPAPKKTRRG
jgi:rod shape-determining protein MreC